jgi:hypothetical protein
VGVVSGIVAIADKGAAHCDASNLCDGPALGGAKSAATAADVSLVAGGLLLGTAVVLYVLPPRHDGGVAITLSPAVSTTRAGLSLGGSF